MSSTPNILLVVLDSVRAKNTSLYGYDRETTPFLEEFVNKDATVYEHAWAPSTSTLPSHASMFSGRPVPEHDVSNRNDKLDDSEHIFKRLRDEWEYSTGVFSENMWLTEVDVGLQDGFDTVVGAQYGIFDEGINPTAATASDNGFIQSCLDHPHPVKSLANGAISKAAWDFPQLFGHLNTKTSPATTYTDLFLDWESNQQGPWGACLNLMDAHRPLSPSEEYHLWSDSDLKRVYDSIDKDIGWYYAPNDEGLWKLDASESLYDGTILQIDHALRELIHSLKKRSVYDDTLIVITGDHGEGFGEPSHIIDNLRVAEHGYGVHESILRVPLIVKEPEQATGKTESALASPTQFKHVVESAMSGNKPTSFTVDNVLSTQPELKRKKSFIEERYTSYDESTLDNPGSVLYEETSEGDILKHVVWGDHALTFEITSPSVEVEVDADTRKKVKDGYSDVRETSLNLGSDARMSEDVKSRLEDLGYK